MFPESNTVEFVTTSPTLVANSTFTPHLAAWGPESDQVKPSREEAEAYTRTLARSHYENFPMASLLLPKKLRQHFFNVYAYCRWADDLGDEVEGTEESLRLLDWWEGELDAMYDSETRHPVFVALQRTVQEFGIPREPFAELISAFRQDQTTATYQTFDELHDYCRRSADPVGRLVLYLIDSYDEANAELSDSICTGLQLVNFWQDVARDADIGRCYLPAEDRRRFGYSDEDFAERRTNEPFIELMRFEVDRAHRFLVAGLPLVDRLRGRFRVDIELFARGGLAMCDRIEAIDYRVWDVRPKISKWEAARLAMSVISRRVLWSRRRPSK
ncbi:squalene synthase HpnC [Stratiformator vulcanicus]|uniref:All-trans-phytoene synthase n=1 Tax=Stratiformator vulcanicus TaxID=2527980 RepID=A0A517R3G0_9PLAN|nr:squalene synthase HpnC [Stratiformator vulcanicus]QDT38435.1 All-trans-phytoene synthase [Stratiformator vulcanicus]